MAYDKKSFLMGLATGLATRGVIDRPAETEPQEAPYLTFSSPSSFTLGVNNTTKNWDGKLEWSGDTFSWVEWDGTTLLTARLDGGQYCVYIRGTGNTIISGYSADRHWVINGSEVRCDGNIETLLDYAAVIGSGHPLMNGFCFFDLFLDCIALVSCPRHSSPVLANGCYLGMYNGSSIRTIPALPATTLPQVCYGRMFFNCPNIKISETQSAEYPYAYRIPISGIGTVGGSDATSAMFDRTGGTFTGTPEINTIYYTSNQIV